MPRGQRGSNRDVIMTTVNPTQLATHLTDDRSRKPQSPGPVEIEHQVYHCPDCGKMVATYSVVALAPQRVGRLYRAIMHWCDGEKCRLGYVAVQRFNGASWDLLGNQFKTRNRNYLDGLRSRIDAATDPEQAIEREAGASKTPAEPS
jgi:hypothetical protein